MVGSVPQLSERDDHNSTTWYNDLDEVAEPAPVQNPNEDPIYPRESLEDARGQEESDKKSAAHSGDATRGQDPESNVSSIATQLYTISYLVLFSLLGTLARLGLQALTFYPGAPIVFSELWANFGGSLIFGFLSEDRMLFKEEWGTPIYHQAILKSRSPGHDEESASSEGSKDLVAAKKAHTATKKTIPLYIGLATGFCGSFTSFSSFIRDAYLGLSNDLPTPLNHAADYSSATVSTSTVPRNGGYSFMALLAVLITTTTVCIAALYVGAHLAISFSPITPSISFKVGRKVLDPLCAFLAWGCWLGAVFLAIFPPDRSSSPEIWRGRAVFALVFAPLGCLGRFYVSMYLNRRISSFPLGTFVVNFFGTMVLGMSYDLQRVPLGGVVGCQVLQGIEDGFCGCLTTVSTWVGELSTLRRSHAYKYGAVSVAAALCSLIVIMGSLQWTRGFSPLLCIH
ncbi:hypothetical protein PVAG01_10731 [Phlyctema vagabunda]|uniref:Chromosome condensation protein n=1 Tax=Phlyctema vagabunda TaxID=108571 RepID=A0ABR4P335_9HELO